MLHVCHVWYIYLQDWVILFGQLILIDPHGSLPSDEMIRNCTVVGQTYKFSYG